MPTETEELRLIVRLDDQASGQLQNLRAHLSQLGSGPVSQGMGQATAKATELEKAFGHLSRSALGVGRATMDVAKIIGPLPVAIGVIGYEFIRQLAHMKEWAGQMTAINNAARMAGVSAGNFRGITDGLRQSGINAGDAAGMVQSLTKSISEAIRPGSQLRNELITMAGVNSNAMTDALQQLSEMTDATDRMNKIRQMGLDVYANNFNKYHDEMRARAAQLQFLQAFGQQQLINQKGEIHKLDKLTLENMDAEARKQDALNTALTQEEQTRQRIWDIIKGSIASQETAAVKVVTKAEGWGQRRLETFESQRNAGTDFMSRGAGGVTGQLPGTSAVHDFLKAHGLAFQHGGIINGPTPGLVGEAGSEAVMPLSALGGGQSKHTESVGENTKQLRMLNEQMEQILNPSLISKYAQGMGGVGAGMGAGDGSGDGTGPGGPGGTSSGPGGNDSTTPPAPGEPGGEALNMESARIGMNPMWDNASGSAQNRPSGGMLGAMVAGGGLTTGGFAKAPRMQWPAAPGAITNATATGGGSAYLAKQRAAMFAEYDKWSPEQKRTLANVAMAENGKSPQDVIESLANRVVGEKGTRANRGGTLWEGLTNGFYSSFHGAYAAAKAGRGNIQLADKIAAGVRGGSDVLEGRSDQGMWTDPGHRDMHARGAAPGTGINALGVARRLKFINGEWYSDKQSISLGAVSDERRRQAEYDASQSPVQVASLDPGSGVGTTTAPPSGPMGFGPFGVGASGTTVASGATGYSGTSRFNFAGSKEAAAMGINIAPDAVQQFAVPGVKGIPGGQIKANKYAGPDFVGFLQDLQAAGAPLTNFSGVYAHREKRGGGGLSQHTYGNAMDIETGFGSGPDNSPYLYKWAQEHPQEFAEIQARHHLRNLVNTGNPKHPHDWGHFEWTPGAVDPAAATVANVGKPKSDWPTSAEDTATTLDKMMAGENKPSDTSGTITIKHGAKPSATPKDKKPAFKDVPDNRQGAMLPAEAGPKAADPAAHVQG
jgi:hypothetical protein